MSSFSVAFFAFYLFYVKLLPTPIKITALLGSFALPMMKNKTPNFLSKYSAHNLFMSHLPRSRGKNVFSKDLRSKN